MTGASTDPGVPSRFKRVLDKATGRHYYYDKETRKTFWKLTEGPGGVPLNVSHEDPRKRRKTYGHPPTDVEAIGYNQGALVWWKVDGREQGKDGTGGKAVGHGLAGGGGGGKMYGMGGTDGGEGEDDGSDPATIGYVVHRYRLDGREWHQKGSTSVDGVKVVSTRVNGLQNGLVYRFTVASKTVKGDSAESKPSVAVRPNEPLPEGWKENFNAITGKSVYKNLKAGHTSAERPDINPYFVETELFLRFTPEEAEALSKEFRLMADMENSTSVSVEDVMEMLPKLGEPLGEAEVVQRLREIGWSGADGARSVASVSYSQFLGLLWSIKGPKLARRSIWKRLRDGIVARATPRTVSAKKLALIEQDPGKRMGAWEKLIHPVARRPYFVNKDTGQASWTMPAEVKFFLNDALRQDLVKTTFSEGDLLGLRKAFARMDLDNNGSVNADELGIVLKSFGEAVPPSRLRALIREVDGDGTGEIDFEEFTLVMQSVRKGKSSVAWGRIDRHLQGDEKKFDGLTDQFLSLKARRVGDGSDAAAGRAKHDKYCLCGCRTIPPGRPGRK